MPVESGKMSSKALSKRNRTAACSQSSNEKQVLCLDLKALKKQEENAEQLASKKRRAEVRRKQEEMDKNAEEFEITKLKQQTCQNFGSVPNE